MIPLAKLGVSVEGPLENLRPVLIPKGTRLYRAAPSVCEYNTPNLGKFSRLDQDTDKVGLYFGTYPVVSLGISIEFDAKQLAEFITVRDITVPYGKFAFRDLNPARYYNRDGKFYVSQRLLPHENISHIDVDLFPLDSKKRHLLDEDVEEFLASRGHGELFLTDLVGDLTAVKFVRAWSIQNTPTIQKLLMPEFSRSLTMEKVLLETSYWEKNDVLTPIKCSVKSSSFEGGAIRRKSRKRSPSRRNGAL